MLLSNDVELELSEFVTKVGSNTESYDVYRHFGVYYFTIAGDITDIRGVIDESLFKAIGGDVID
jgi:hypothetical protein